MPTQDEKYIKAKLQHQHVSRRGLFRGLLRGGQKSLEKSDTKIIRTVPRPPGAIDEGIFARLCDGCGQCAAACPREVLRVEQQLPRLDLDYNHCDLCGLCNSACPTNALVAFGNEQVRKTELQPHFSQACHNRLLGHCDLCVEDCPQQAISIDSGNLPKLDHSRCNGCGECQGACPARAIALKLTI